MKLLSKRRLFTNHLPCSPPLSSRSSHILYPTLPFPCYTTLTPFLPLHIRDNFIALGLLPLRDQGNKFPRNSVVTCIMQGTPNDISRTYPIAQAHSLPQVAPLTHRLSNCLPSNLHGPRRAGCQTGMTAASGSYRNGACFCGASANG